MTARKQDMMTEERQEYAVTVVPTPTGAMLPAIGLEVAIERRNQLVKFVKEIMVENTDFGTIPGTDKPTLYKAGAEKLKTFFGLTHQFEFIERIEDWDRMFFYYLVRCRLFRDGCEVGQGDGSCNSRISKYRYRYAERKCPNCGQEAIRRSKAPKTGYYCWSKLGGCGAQFQTGDPKIEGQVMGKVENPDIADQVNTILKMAEKNSLVASVLITVNASQFFNQDMEDMIDGETGEITTQPRTEQPKSAHTNGGQKSSTPPEPEEPTETEPGKKKPEPSAVDVNARKSAFYDKVLKEIPYYEHIKHAGNTLRKLGFTGYSIEGEDAMFAALQKYANDAANADADGKPLDLGAETEKASAGVQ